MGIVNATPDSFYGGSRADSESALRERIAQVVAEGADIIDIGGYSTRPGAADVSPDEELRRLRVAAMVLAEVAPALPASVDTFRADVALCAVEQLGFDIVNDIGAGTLDPRMAATVARLRVPYIAMHMRGTPATMTRFTQYDNVVNDVITELGTRLDTLRNAGVDQIIADPGFGFAKTTEQNYTLLAGLEQFSTLGVPLLVGVSRKSMIYRLLGCTPDSALNGTTAANTIALLKGAHIIRVHDARAAAEARAIVEQITNNHFTS